MATYNTLTELISAMDDALPPIMEGQLADEVKDLLQTAMEANVYKYKESKWYKRRGKEGGLADKRLMVANYDKGSRELTVYSNAEGTYSHSGMRMDTLVERADEEDYDWGGNAAIPRPFYQETEQVMSRPSFTTWFEEIIITELEKVL